MSTQREGSGGAPRLGPRDELLDRDRRRADPVREPARVRHLVDRVDVLRARARRLVARRDEQVVRSSRTSTRSHRAAPSTRPATPARARSDRPDRSAGPSSRRRWRAGRARRPARIRTRRRDVHVSANDDVDMAGSLRRPRTSRRRAPGLRGSSPLRCAAAWRTVRGNARRSRSRSSARRNRDPTLRAATLPAS